MDEFNATPDYTSSFDPADVQRNRGMGVLAYLGLLVLIPLLAARESPFARFHCNQGIVLAFAEAVAGIAFRILKHLPIIGRLFAISAGIVGIVAFVFSIIGIVNAANGRAKELPVIGSIQILK